MIFKHHLHETRQVTADEIPQRYQHLLIPHATCYYASGLFGTVISQMVTETEFTVWQHNFFIEQPCILIAENDVPSIVVNYMLQGSPFAKLKGRHEPLIEANTYRLFFVPAITHPVSFLEGEYWCIHVNYHVRLLREYIGRNLRLTQLLDFVIQDGKELLHYLSGEIDDHMKTSLIDMLWYNHKRRQAHVRQLAYRLLFGYVRRHHAIRDDLSTVESYIMRNLDKYIEVEHLIKYCAMSSTKFHEKFRAQFGVSPYQYIKSKRMELARVRLLESNMPITRIAELSGFTSLSSFSTAFKKYWGSAPVYLRTSCPTA